MVNCKAVIACLKTLFLQSPGQTNKKQNIKQDSWPAEIQLDTSRVEGQSLVYCFEKKPSCEQKTLITSPTKSQLKI